MTTLQDASDKTSNLKVIVTSPDFGDGGVVILRCQKDVIHLFFKWGSSSSLAMNMLVVLVYDTQEQNEDNLLLFSTA